NRYRPLAYENFRKSPGAVLPRNRRSGGSDPTHGALRHRLGDPDVSFPWPDFPTNMARSSQKAGGSMPIEKCINEYDVGDVIFEEGSSGRELFVVLDGKIEIAKISGDVKTVIVSLGKGEFFGEMAVIDGSSRSATAIAAAPNTRGV